MNILQIHSSARADGSHSSRLARSIVERVQASLPDPAAPRSPCATSAARRTPS